MLVSLGSVIPGMGLVDAQGHHLVKRHKMTCNAAFPCPQALRPRVDFWIDVYSRWTSKDAVLHDANKPDRVYDVVRGQTCRSRKGSKLVTRQKAVIAGELRSLATKVSQRKKVWGYTGPALFEYVSTARFRGDSPRGVKHSLPRG